MGVLLAGCSSTQPVSTIPTASAPTSVSSTPVATETETETKAANAVSFDQQFIDSMVPHHESALMMAQMVEGRAQFPEVRTLAKSIIAEQTKEIAQMKSWRKAWFGSDQIPPMAGHESMDHSTMDHSKMDHSKMGNMDMNMDMSASNSGSDVMTMPGSAMGLPITGAMDMKKIRDAKGSAVDREFLRMMIPHHANAITMAQEVLIQSKRPELQKLARQIIAAQAREIGTMEAIARQHFGSL